MSIPNEDMWMEECDALRKERDELLNALRDAREGMIGELRTELDEANRELDYVRKQLMRVGDHSLPEAVDRIVYERTQALAQIKTLQSALTPKQG